MPFSTPFMRQGLLGLILLFLATALAACAPIPATVTPADLRDPDPRTMVASRPLSPLPEAANGNSPMIEAYAQCRLAHADGSDRHLGLIHYVKALRGK